MTKQKMRQSGFAVVAACTIGSMAGTSVLAQQPAGGGMLRLDATAPIPPAGPADYQGGTSVAPDGSTLGVTDRYLTRNGKPWLPVMGELHYSRVPESQWEDAILQMKSAGVDIISTYVIWIHHEEVKDQWEWSGNKDLRHFAELCQKHGMLLYPRLGPWAHGEVRNGGLPDWVMAAGPIRQEDPTFMAETKTLYDQAGEQLRGMLWKDGGPVIGVQIENEYAMRGPGKGEQYILALKKMAVAAGFDVPLYTVTGWDNAVVPKHKFLPVYGGYPDAPWGASRTALPPQEVYAFRFGSRVSGSMGMIGAAGGGAAEMAATTPAAQDAPQVPFLTAEIGGGMQDTYHRRLIMSADDIAAMMPVMLGSGVNLYGSYMFHGGENPQGKLTTLEESQATHYPTDVPVKNYDFQAPISEYGLERPSLRLLKDWDYFLNDFGSMLAPMPAFRPKVVPHGPTDLSVLRWSVRTDGHAGFLFANNYVRGTPMPARPHTQFSIALPGGRTVRLPETPIDIPSGAYFAWPFALDLGGVELRYGTAQLMTRVAGPEGETFAFSCIRDVRCELALEGESLNVQAPADIHVEHRAGATVLTRTLTPAGGSGTPRYSAVAVHTSAGTIVHLLLLAPEQAADTWKAAGGLIETSADLFADGSTTTLRQLGDPTFHFTLYPAPVSPPQAVAAVKPTGGESFVAQLRPIAASVIAQPGKPAGMAPPIALGPPLSWRPVGVAQAPDDATWSADAARWSLAIKPTQIPSAAGSTGVRNLFLRVGYAGDQARLLSDGKLLDDDFFNGEQWLVGLDRYTVSDRIPPLELELLPMRSDAPVYLPPAGRAQIAASGQTVKLDGITLIPQYQLQLTGPAAKP